MGLREDKFEGACVARRFRKSGLLWAALALGIVSLAGCGFGDEEATATDAVGQQVTATPAAANTAAATAPPTSTTAAEPSATVAVSVEPLPSSQATASPTRPAPTATATPNPVVSSGEELSVNGTPVERISAVGVEGWTLYGETADGLLRSDDAGAAWNPVGEVQPGEMIASENDPDALYSGDRAGCGRGFSDIPYSASNDGGATWTEIEDNQGTQPLVAYTADGQSVLFGTDCGLKISTDGGATWSPVADLAGEDVFAIASEQEVAPAQMLVVGVTEGGTGRLFLLETSDLSAPALAGALTQFWANAEVDWSAGRIVLATAHQVGVSDDGGQNWFWTRAGIEDVTYSVDPLEQGIPVEEQSAGFGPTTVVIDPTDRDRIWLGTNHGAFRSVDGGASWIAMGDSEAVDSIVVSPASERVFVSAGGVTRVWTLDGE